MNLINRYMTKNPYYNDGKWITGSSFKGFFLHSVGCAQPNPLVFIRNWDNASYTSAGINGFIGSDDVYITAPCLETPGKVKRMPHAGVKTTNDGYIGFEMTEPGCIKYTYGDRFTCSDLPAAKSFVQKTYRNAVELFSKLCAFHGKNPLADGVILSHCEAGKRGLATGHSDPEHLWSQLGLSYTMDGFRKDVKAFMEGDVLTTMTKEELIALIDEKVSDKLKSFDKEITTEFESKIKSKLDEKLTGRNTKPSDWAKDEISEAVAKGISDGDRPLGYAKREEVIAMILRSTKL